MLKQGALRRRLSDQVLERVQAWCEMVPGLQTEPAVRWLETLTPIDDIDPGEALLLAQLAEEPTSILLTGDKRALRTLSSHSELAALTRRLTGRICCVETALRVCVDAQQNIEGVASALSPLRRYNTMIRAVFSRGEDTRIEDFRAAIESYEEALRREVAEGLLFKP